MLQFFMINLNAFRELRPSVTDKLSRYSNQGLEETCKRLTSASSRGCRWHRGTVGSCSWSQEGLAVAANAATAAGNGCWWLDLR